MSSRPRPHLASSSRNGTGASAEFGDFLFEVDQFLAAGHQV